MATSEMDYMNIGNIRGIDLYKFVNVYKVASLTANTELAVDMSSGISDFLTNNPDYEFVCLLPNGGYRNGQTQITTRVSISAPQKVTALSPATAETYVYGIAIFKYKYM